MRPYQGPPRFSTDLEQKLQHYNEQKSKKEQTLKKILHDAQELEHKINQIDSEIRLAESNLREINTKIYQLETEKNRMQEDLKVLPKF